MGDFSAFMSCNIGGTDFQLLQYSYSAEPVVREGFGRIGTRVTIEGEGYVRGASFGGVADAIAAASDSLSISGQSIAIFGVGGVPEQLLAAGGCVDGGPHINFSFETGTVGLQRKTKFHAVGSTAPDSPLDTYTQKVAVKPDGLLIVTRSGTIYGPNGQSYFDGTALPAFQASYTLPNWVVKYDSSVTSDIYLTTVAYSMEAVQMHDPLPVMGGVVSVEGTASQNIGRDEQNRLTTTYDFDLVIDGNAGDFLTALRAQLFNAAPQNQSGNVVIYTETSRIASITENRLQASFTIVTGADQDDLVEWHQTFEGQYGSGADASPGNSPDGLGGFGGPPLIGLEYSGAAPIIIVGPQPVYRYSQKGSATGTGRYPKQPDPLYAQNLEGLPKLTFSPPDILLCTTAWEYTFIFTTPLTIDTAPPLDQLGRPSPPTYFQTPGAPAAPPPADNGPPLVFAPIEN